MSFTSEVKDELSRIEPTCSHCDKAELSALIRIEGTLSIGEDGPRLELATETASVARTAIRLLHGIYNLRTDLTVRRSILHKTHNYLITAPAQGGLTEALHDMGIFGAGGFERGIKPGLVERGCCAGAYLRGAFLGGGYIADPRGDFHFELAAPSEEFISACLGLMREYGIRARSIRRHNMYTAYIKGVDQIIAFLAFVGAHQGALAIENARVIKSLRNDTNRRVNAEIANQVKTSNAAMQQIDLIRRLVETRGADSIPASLQEVAMLRLRNPDASIKELGELADPPLSKNAVYHRLRRIAALVDEQLICVAGFNSPAPNMCRAPATRGCIRVYNRQTIGRIRKVHPMGEALEIAKKAREASHALGVTSSQMRNAALNRMADQLVSHTSGILKANEMDMDAAREKDTPAPLLDRLMLTAERIADIAEGLRQVAAQPEVLGEIVEGRDLYNGLHMRKYRVPLGVVAMIYEARPNVTADAAGLCIKTGNACILRGGSLAQRSCLAISKVLADAACEAGLPANSIQSIESTGHDATDELMSLAGFVDVLIPRGGAGLIQYCVNNATVPVIETGTGNCHVYIHAQASPSYVLPIVINAKTQRPGVCNACESLLVDDEVADELLPDVLAALSEAGVVIHADEHAAKIAAGVDVDTVPATDEDWGTEYLDMEISIKCISGVDEAIAHVNTYGTGHSECIISEDARAIERFEREVDAAVVYANASTRFTDGGEFGLGAEIGISTQKLHARGPMGAAALTSTKYIVDGMGQTRG